MLNRAVLGVVLVLALPLLHSTLSACGDKFLMVGGGARFQRIYASVNPGKLLIYARPSTSGKAAIRDPKFHKTLRQAGHSVSVIEDWALLEQALKTVPIDVVLVDAGEAARLRGLLPSAVGRPDLLFIAFPSEQPPSDVVCRLKSSDRPLKYLDEIEITMKARKGRTRS